MKKITFLVILCLIFPLGLFAQETVYDLGITAGDISFSDELIAGQNIRIYASVRNLGNTDVAGYVTFYKGNALIGDSQVVSVKAASLADEVFVDFTVPVGSFNIRAEIKGQTPTDENPNNDVAITTLFVPIHDNDRDGLPDDQDEDDDNDGVSDEDEAEQGTDPFDSDSDDDGCLDGDDSFPTDPNECTDNDGDGMGDNQDVDDDNDGLNDNQEDQLGTDPNNPDTDNDDVKDGQDDYPLDPNRFQEPNIGSETENNQDDSDEQEDTDSEDENIDESEDQVEENDEPIELDESEEIKQKVKVKVEKKKWNTYIFSPDLRGVTTENLVYAWDLGDGTMTNQKVVEHQYAKAGKYTVNLKVMGPNDLELTDSKQINISFFNWANNKIKALIAAFVAFLVALLIAFLKGLAIFGRR